MHILYQSKLDAKKVTILGMWNEKLHYAFAPLEWERGLISSDTSSPRVGREKLGAHTREISVELTHLGAMGGDTVAGAVLFYVTPKWLI